MRVSDLRLYPIKSCRGVSVSSAMVRARGFQFDRRAMIVSPDGTFLTQRSHPKLAQILVAASPDLELRLGDELVRAAFTSERLQVTVWRDQVSACIADHQTNSALSDFLGEPVRLVWMDEVAARKTNPASGPQSDVSFADGYPFLITTTASLQALSETAGEAIPMERFRPNIVIDTETPWIEDDWKRLLIGDQTFDLVKPCTRCVVTTLDQETGGQVGQSTMDALIKTRARSGDWGRGVIFGVNAIARKPGHKIERGMSVTVR